MPNQDKSSDMQTENQKNEKSINNINNINNISNASAPVITGPIIPNQDLMSIAPENINNHSNESKTCSINKNNHSAKDNKNKKESRLLQLASAMRRNLARRKR